MKVEWSKEARADLARILTFNIDRSDQWAERVDSRLRQRAEALGQSPLMGRRIAFALPALSVPDIQYVILYRVAAEQVTILGVASTREKRSWE